MPRFSPHTAAGRTTSARAVLESVRKRVDGDDERRPWPAPGGPASRSGKSASGSAPRSTSAWMPAVGRGRAGSRRRRAPGVAGTPPQAAANQPRPASSATRPGRNPGAEPDVERAVDVAAPQRRQEAHAGHGSASAAAAATVASADSASDGRPSDHDDVAVGVGRRRSGSSRGRRRARRVARSPTPGWRQRRERARHGQSRGLAREVAERDVGVAGQPGGRGGDLDQRHAEVDGGPAQPQVEDGQLLLEVGAEEHDGPGACRSRRWWPGAGRARPRRAGRRPAGSRRCRCRARPWRAGPDVGVLVGAPGAAEHRHRRRRRRGRSAPRRPSAAASSASGHEHSTSSPLARAPSARTRRSAWWTHSKPKRPLSHSQPWLTGSESTPSRRTSRFGRRLQRAAALHRAGRQDVSTAVEVPRAGPGTGRARPCSAPTGQIWTVLPEKYEVNGSSGNVSTCVSPPRSHERR